MSKDTQAIKLNPMALMGVDVQQAKNGLWWLVADVADCRQIDEATRRRLHLGAWTIGIRDWYNCQTFAEVNEVSLKYRAQYVAVDANYKLRRTEVYQAAAQYKFVPIMGRARDNLSMLWKKDVIDPYEGRRGGGNHKHQIAQLMFQSDTMDFKTVDLIVGNIPDVKLIIPSPADPLLARHLQSTMIVDGVITKRRSGQYVDDHLYDCLKYIVLLAMYLQRIPA